MCLMSIRCVSVVIFHDICVFGVFCVVFFFFCFVLFLFFFFFGFFFFFFKQKTAYEIHR